LWYKLSMMYLQREEAAPAGGLFVYLLLL